MIEAAREREEDETGADDDAEDEQDFHPPYLGHPQRISSGQAPGEKIGGERMYVAAAIPQGAERVGGVPLGASPAVRPADQPVVTIDGLRKAEQTAGPAWSVGASAQSGPATTHDQT